MRIKEEVYKKLKMIPYELPHESGGILGGKKGVVTRVVFDEGIDASCACSYVPDVKKLNNILWSWKEEQVDFMGMFHTHFWSVSTLSDGDKKYIEKIVRNMPECIERLYFPIVTFPERRMVVYKAYLIKEQLVIEEDKIIIEEEE